MHGIEEANNPARLSYRAEGMIDAAINLRDEKSLFRDENLRYYSTWLQTVFYTIQYR